MPGTVKWLIAASLIASGYAFCISLTLAPIVGHRGLSYRGPLMAKVIYAGNAFGSVTSLIATLALICAAFVSL